jgi:hypothetical protein
LCHDSAVAHDRAAGAPANEIEITPEMIEEGRAAYAGFYLDLQSAETDALSRRMVEAIFLAMMKARLGPPS